MSFPASKLVDALTVPVRKPLPSGLNGTKPMPRSSHVAQHLFLGTPPPERVLALDCRHRVHRVRPADGSGGGLGQTEMLHLSRIDEILDRACDLLDGHLRVHPVLVVEIDGVDSQSAKGTIDHQPDDVGVAGHPSAGLAFDGIDVPPELGGDHHLALERGEGLADEFLVGIGAVDLGRVEEGDAALDCGAHQRDHLVPVGCLAVAAGHAHTAQPDGGDLQAVGAEGARFHGSKLRRLGCAREVLL